MKYKKKDYAEWTFIYEGDKCIIRMNQADFETDEEMDKYVQMILNKLNN